jgi:hypothetical protein
LKKKELIDVNQSFSFFCVQIVLGAATFCKACFLKIFEKVWKKKQWFWIGFILDLEGLLLNLQDYKKNSLF